jgi:hypothetical protein
MRFLTAGGARRFAALLLLAFSAFTGTAGAQPAMVEGRVSAAEAGFSYMTPEGWITQSLQGVYRIASSSAPGVILVYPHQHGSLDELRRLAMEGLQEDDGTMLAPASQPQSFAPNGVVADYSGLFQWTQAKARGIGLLSPHGGGVVILALAESGSFTDEFGGLADQIARSVEFTKPKTGPIADVWRQKLAGMRVVYMESYSSSGGSYGGYSTGGGYSMETNYYLCSSGDFSSSDSSSLSVDTGGAFGNSASSGRGEGRWEVAVVAGTPVLRLSYHSGQVVQYELSTDDGQKTYLDGQRWYVVENPVCR